MEGEGGGRKGEEWGTRIQITALDGIVNVNSLFTLAVFIGLTTDMKSSLVSDRRCVGSRSIAENIVKFQVYSFSSFLFSSLVALALKQVMRIANSSSQHPRAIHLRDLTFDLALINRTALRVGYLISAAGSVSGCICLMLALINVVQIKLGTLGCGSSHSYGAVVPLVILVPSALFIYVCAVTYAFTR